MLAANVWHWWIGVALALVGVLVVAGLVGAYMKSVVSQEHPSRGQQSRHHTDL